MGVKTTSQGRLLFKPFGEGLSKERDREEINKIVGDRGRSWGVKPRTSLLNPSPNGLNNSLRWEVVLTPMPFGLTTDPQLFFDNQTPVDTQKRSATDFFVRRRDDGTFTTMLSSPANRKLAIIRL